MSEGKPRTETPARPAPSRAPPWEALPLVGPFLGAESLAAASCVCTTWRAAFAADHLWSQLCRAHYPSALGLLPLPDPDNDDDDDSSARRSSPHRRLFALFHAAYVRRRALPTPRLAIDDVTFAIDLFAASGRSALSFAVAARDAGAESGMFQFVANLSGRNAAAGPGEYWRVRWTAVRTALGAATAAVVMMDAKVPAARAGALGSGGRGEAWAMERLPAPGCSGARLEAEVVLEVAGEERLVERIRFGVLLECRYVSVDGGLRYLEHFLM